MWARVDFAVRRAGWRALGALGTAPVSAALLALVAAYQLAVLLASRLGTEEGAEALATSWPFGALYGVAILDAVAATCRDVPAAFPEWFSARAARPPRRARLAALGTIALDLAWLLVAAGLATSLLARDRFTLWTAAGERFEGAPGQYLSRAPPRPMSPGPQPLSFEVDRVEPELDAAGRLRTLEVGLVLDGERATATRRRAVWLGGARFLYASGYGYAPRYEVADGSGTVLDAAFVKLALLPPGKLDHVRSAAFPHRLYVKLPDGARLRGGEEGLRDLALEVNVFRGKLPVGGGLVRRGDELRFEGLALRIPEVRYVAELTLVDDAGLLLVAAALALALLGAALRFAGRGSAPAAGR